MAVPKKKGTSRTPAKKTGTARKKKNAVSIKSLAALFWLIFCIVIICLFVFNWPKIQQTVSESQVFERLRNRDTGTVVNVQPQLDPPEVVIERPPPIPDTTPAVTQPPVTETPALSEYGIYMIRIDSAGDVYVVKVNRQIPVSNSPLVDALASLMEGPTRDEQNRGLVSLIPAGTRIIPGQTTVRGNTASISLSEDIQYNTDGIEGYVAALRQIIWTATEFAVIEDVQILIEGRRIDYLGGDGIWIGTPLNRRF